MTTNRTAQALLEAGEVELEALKRQIEAMDATLKTQEEELLRERVKRKTLELELGKAAPEPEAEQLVARLSEQLWDPEPAVRQSVCPLCAAILPEEGGTCSGCGVVVLPWQVVEHATSNLPHMPGWSERQVRERFIMHKAGT